MPRIPPNALDIVCYLYESVESAKAGREFGGTGFLVGVQSERFPRLITHVYAVTNWHVACRNGQSVIRLNTKAGGVDIIEFGPDQWHFLPEYDIAVVPVPLDRAIHRYKLMPIAGFLTKDHISRHMLGPGEDVFMVGRFVDHDGGVVNMPAVRFGNVSVMPTPIEQPNGRMADVFCIDLHSRSGYSGSPVLLYRTPGYDLEAQLGTVPQLLCSGVNLMLLLGIHVSQFPEMWEIGTAVANAKRESGEPLILEGKYIRGLSGMTCVLPAWIIAEVINMAALKKLRAEADEHWSQAFARSGIQPREIAEIKAVDDLSPIQKDELDRFLSPGK